MDSNILIILVVFIGLPLIVAGIYLWLRRIERKIILQEIKNYYNSDNFRVLNFGGDIDVTVKLINPDGNRETLVKRYGHFPIDTLANIERALNEYYKSPYFTILSNEYRIIDVENKYKCGYKIKVKNPNRKVEVIYLDHM